MTTTDPEDRAAYARFGFKEPSPRFTLAHNARMQLANAEHCLRGALAAADLIGARDDFQRIMSEISACYRKFVDISLEEDNQ